MPKNGERHTITRVCSFRLTGIARIQIDIHEWIVATSDVARQLTFIEKTKKNTIIVFFNCLEFSMKRDQLLVPLI
jgi:hypothetical protein